MLGVSAAFVFVCLQAAYAKQTDGAMLSVSATELNVAKRARIAWHAIFTINFLFFIVWGGLAYIMHDSGLASREGGWAHVGVSCFVASLIVVAKGRTGIY